MQLRVKRINLLDTSSIPIATVNWVINQDSQEAKFSNLVCSDNSWAVDLNNPTHLLYQLLINGNFTLEFLVTDISNPNNYFWIEYDNDIRSTQNHQLELQI